MAVTQIDGLVSNLKTGEIVDALIQASRAATRVLEKRKEQLGQRLEAVRSLNTKLLSAQLDIVTLRRAPTFQARTATSSNTDALAVSATSSAVPGTYRLDVVAVAKAHQLRTTGKTSATASNGSGTVTLQVGNGVEKTITATDTSLNGLAKAINDAKAGVTATVINDGSSDPAGPFKLVLQANETGAANDIAISGTGDLNTLFASGNLTTLSQAGDAEIRLGGSGVGETPITIFKASNTVSDIIPGVTLTLKDAANNLTVTVAANPVEAKTAVKTFIESVNKAITFLNEQTAFNPTTKVAGVLQSDVNVRSGADSVIRALTGVVPGLPSVLNNFGALGVTIDRAKGTLILDEAKLDAQLAADPSGVQNLFTNTATSTSNAVSFAALSEKTAVSSPFAVVVTRAGTQARATTAGNLAASTLIDGTNNTLNVTLNGSALSVTLASGTYARDDLAEQVQNAINAAAATTGNRVTAGLDGTALDLRSAVFGSAQSVTITGGSALTALNLTATTSTGVDVQATINGGSTLTGTGQILFGGVATAAEGLRLVVTATAAEVTSGVSATITARKGLAQLVDERLGGLTDSTVGSIAQREDALERSIIDMTEQIAKVDARLEQRRQRFLAQFRRMEQLTQQFQSQGNVFQQQVQAGFGQFRGNNR